MGAKRSEAQVLHCYQNLTKSAGMPEAVFCSDYLLAPTLLPSRCVKTPKVHNQSAGVVLLGWNTD